MGLGSEIRDPESGINLSRIQGSKRHRIPDPDPQHWYLFLLFFGGKYKFLAGGGGGGRGKVFPTRKQTLAAAVRNLPHLALLQTIFAESLY